MYMLDNYFYLQNCIHRYFGYEQDWRIYPIVDKRNYYWSMDEKEECVVNTEFEDDIFKSDAPCRFEVMIYKDRWLKKSVFRSNEYTMILVDTQCDGNIYLAIYDNLKEK